MAVTSAEQVVAEAVFYQTEVKLPLGSNGVAMRLHELRGEVENTLGGVVSGHVVPCGSGIDAFVSRALS